MTDKSCENCASLHVCELHKAATAHFPPIAGAGTINDHPFLPIVGWEDGDDTLRVVDKINELRRQIISHTNRKLGLFCQYYTLKRKEKEDK